VANQPKPAISRVWAGRKIKRLWIGSRGVVTMGSGAMLDRDRQAEMGRLEILAGARFGIGVWGMGLYSRTKN